MEAPLSMLSLKNIRWQNENCILKAYCSWDSVVVLWWRINVFALDRSNVFVHDGWSVRIYYIAYPFFVFQCLAFVKGVMDVWPVTQQTLVFSINIFVVCFYNLLKIWKVEIQNLAKPNSTFSLLAGKQSSIDKKGGHSCYIEFKGKLHADFQRAAISPRESCSGVLYFGCLCIHFPFSIVSLCLRFLQYHDCLPRQAQVSPCRCSFLTGRLDSSHPGCESWPRSAPGPRLPSDPSPVWDLDECINLYKAHAYCSNDITLHKTLNATSKLQLRVMM